MITNRERLLGKVVDAIRIIGPGATRKDLVKYLERESDAQDFKTRHYGVALRNAVDCGLVKKLKSGRYSLVHTAQEEDKCKGRGRSRGRGRKRSRSRSGDCKKKCKICRNKLGMITRCRESRKKSKGRCGKRKRSRSGKTGKSGRRSGSRCGKRRRRRKRSKGRCGKRSRR